MRPNRLALLSQFFSLFFLSFNAIAENEDDRDAIGQKMSDSKCWLVQEVFLKIVPFSYATL
jgi:hypothetical protein